ncbi:hypothetical protein RRG08_033771 [Elysia crispata]|uniref:Uncharacterized protein n=1 Tax=Elysia crispata TaxID=231223 RepID=A0AAE1AT96_9GAST|nr:hypothetical protein RRG08_033771 [Elysia crispata]
MCAQSGRAVCSVVDLESTANCLFFLRYTVAQDHSWLNFTDLEDKVVLFILILCLIPLDANENMHKTNALDRRI